MLDALKPHADAAAHTARASRGDGTVYLAGLGHALPPHRASQDEIKARAARLLGPKYPQFSRLAPAYDSAGVDFRHSVVPFDWFETDQTWSSRNAAYLAGATALFVSAALAALSNAGIRATDVDTIVTVSSTGVATPSLEARAFGEMGFRQDVHRLPVFGLGCAGGATGLAIARRMAAACPGSTVLLVTVEACSTAFRSDRMQKADIIASVLFGDGAAAAVLSTTPPRKGGTPRVVVGEGAEYLWRDTLGIMGWDVDDTGLGVVFDRAIPDFASAELRGAVDAMLGGMGMTCGDIDRFVCHPGGAKVITAIEDALDLAVGTLDSERAVLRDMGNMSAPTALVVLGRALAAGSVGQLALLALGPGFTASLVPITVETGA